jgi:hypothetical protein
MDCAILIVLQTYFFSAVAWSMSVNCTGLNDRLSSLNDP